MYRAPYDAIDRSIAGLLQESGRITNRQIAETLGLTATMVSSRIKRLEETDQLRVVAVCDFSASGWNFLMRVSIEVCGSPASEVAEALAAFPEVLAVHLVTGRFDIEILVVLRDFDHLSGLLNTRLSHVRGIRAMVPSVVVDVVKCDSDAALIGVSDVAKF